MSEQTEITKEGLYALGFGAINEHYGVSEYLSFPEPLRRQYFIKNQKEKNIIPNGWTIYIHFTSIGHIAIKWPANMEEINSFYFGICDKNLF